MSSKKQIRDLAVKVNNLYEYYNVVSLCESGKQTSKEEILKNESLNDIVFDGGDKTFFMHNWKSELRTMPIISYEDFIKEYVQ